MSFKYILYSCIKKNVNRLLIQLNHTNYLTLVTHKFSAKFLYRYNDIRKLDVMNFSDHLTRDYKINGAACKVVLASLRV